RGGGGARRRRRGGYQPKRLATSTTKLARPPAGTSTGSLPGRWSAGTSVFTLPAVRYRSRGEPVSVQAPGPTLRRVYVVPAVPIANPVKAEMYSMPGAGHGAPATRPAECYGTLRTRG